MPRGGVHSSRVRAETEALDARVVELYRTGLTFAQVGAAVGLSASGACRAWERAMRRAPKIVVDRERQAQLDEWRAQLRRLYAELAQIQGEDLDAETRLEMRLKVEDRIARNIQARARLLGTEAPQRARIEVIEIDQVLEAVELLEAQATELANRRQGMLPAGHPEKVIEVS